MAVSPRQRALPNLRECFMRCIDKNNKAPSERAAATQDAHAATEYRRAPSRSLRYDCTRDAAFTQAPHREFCSAVAARTPTDAMTGDAATNTAGAQRFYEMSPPGARRLASTACSKNAQPSAAVAAACCHGGVMLNREAASRNVSLSPPAPSTKRAALRPAACTHRRHRSRSVDLPPASWQRGRLSSKSQTTW